MCAAVSLIAATVAATLLDANSSDVEKRNSSAANSSKTEERSSEVQNGTQEVEGASDPASDDGQNSGAANNIICRYFLRGTCRFGPMCRFVHDSSAVESTDLATEIDSNHPKAENTSNGFLGKYRNYQDWAKAPVFIPTGQYDPYIGNSQVDESEVAGAAGYSAEENEDDQPTTSASYKNSKTWADVLFRNGDGVASTSGGSSKGAPVRMSGPGTVNSICPYEGPCPYGIYCAYKIHLDLCEMCDQYCLHPDDVEQRRKHNKECLQQHEQAMELSFAIARSRDKTCGICMDIIMEKAGKEKRFGILPNCTHIFCLECIRKWRQAKQFEHKITRSCPECRIASDFVCPSAFWVDTKEEKDKLLTDYRKALGIKDCKYFKKGDGKCPFGNKCFYKHALADGTIVDVGGPRQQRARKLHRQNEEIMELIDLYLWEYIDQRDLNYHFLRSNTASDESDLSDDGLEYDF